MSTLPAGKNLPTAVLACNDLIAIGAMDAIKQHGLSIPQDINVICFDDIGMASEVNPTLTMVHVPKKTIGLMAVRRFLQIVKGIEDQGQKVLVPTRLVIRNSSAAPRS